MEKNKSLMNLYSKTADYIGFNKENSTAYNIVKEGVNTLKDTMFTELYERCIALVNVWDDKEADWLIEDISASLGEYFD